MRTNLPVTGKEFVLGDEDLIVSKTDLKGRITYVNRDFVRISGYVESELLGVPHNLVRHPDMPVEAFEDLWRDLKAGRPWTGYVKNRCKNGDHYWVLANATPIWENGQVTGYMSVRRKPDAAVTRQLDLVYRQFREKKQGSQRIQHGQIATGSSFRIANVSLGKKLGVLIGFLIATLVIQGLIGLFQVSRTNDVVGSVFEERTEPTRIIGRIGKLMADNRAHVLLGLLHDPTSPAAKAHEHPVKVHTDAVRANIAEISELWKTYGKIAQPEGTKKLADEYAEARGRFVKQGLLPAIEALEAGRFADANALVTDQVNPNYVTASGKADEIFTLLSDSAKQQYAESQAQFSGIRWLTIAGVLFVGLLAAAASAWLLRSITRPLAQLVDTLLNVAQGNYSNVVDVSRDDEIGKAMQGLQSTQTRLGFEVAEAVRQANEMTRVKIALDNVSTGVMIADADRSIIYVNNSVQRILKGAEEGIRKQLPHFSADKLVGENIDLFHKNPAHQAGLLAKLDKAYTAQLVIGDRRMQVTANPVVNEQGERLGAVAEWLDRTEELAAAEREAKLAAENLRVRIALDNVATGAMIADNERNIVYINKSVHKMLKNAESAIRQQLPSFNADTLVGTNIDSFHKNPAHQARLLAEFTQPYTAPLNIGGRHLVVTANPVINDKGERLGAVAEWIDRTPEVQVEQEVENLIIAAGEGNFDARLALEGKDGFFRKLAEGLNQLSATVSAGLTDVGDVLKSVARGDLTRTIEADYQGLFGELKDDTNTTIARLREVVGRIKEATDLINTAAKEIAAGNTDLSARTEEQASSLEQTASSMEELNSTVKQNAENATQANTLAKTSNEAAVKSGQMVQQIVSTMTGISESSKKIADIIGVIDSIAFQTNILALNAAVEAARAGEQGRGFAVVATEVRNLAQRSATAAKEIKELIAESTGKVETGGRLVSQAGTAMDGVVSSFQQVTALVTDISNASREQASGIEQVTQAVGQMDEVTQQNAALVEEAAAAAESLEEQATALVHAVAMFKLDEGATGVPGPALRTVAPPRQVAARSVPPAPPAPSSAARKLPPPMTAGGSGDEWEEF